LSLTIRGKLLLGFGVVLLLMIFMGGFNYIAFTNNSESMNEFRDRNLLFCWEHTTTQ
jgi:CHASE3 domain sensor protein